MLEQVIEIPSILVALNIIEYGESDKIPVPIELFDLRDSQCLRGIVLDSLKFQYPVDSIEFLGLRDHSKVAFVRHCSSSEQNALSRGREERVSVCENWEPTSQHLLYDA